MSEMVVDGSGVLLDLRPATGFGHEAPPEPWRVWMVQAGEPMHLRRFYTESEARELASVLGDLTGVPFIARPSSSGRPTRPASVVHRV